MSTTMNADSEPPAGACTLSAALSRRWMVMTLLVLAVSSMVVWGLGARSVAAQEVEPAESTAPRPVAATACVVDERGEAVESAIVEQYVDRTWGWGGRTGNDGCINLQAPTGSARFRVWVGGLWLRVDQNVGVDPLVVFELVDASVEVVDS
ncbi:MAG: hypothetical protein ACE367_16295, partial [Acidimicrobiales bacterium]